MKNLSLAQKEINTKIIAGQAQQLSIRKLAKFINEPESSIRSVLKGKASPLLTKRIDYSIDKAYSKSKADKKELGQITKNLKKMPYGNRVQLVKGQVFDYKKAKEIKDRNAAKSASEPKEKITRDKISAKDRKDALLARNKTQVKVLPDSAKELRELYVDPYNPANTPSLLG